MYIKLSGKLKFWENLQNLREICTEKKNLSNSPILQGWSYDSKKLPARILDLFWMQRGQKLI